jgi:hypothetical protein
MNRLHRLALAILAVSLLAPLIAFATSTITYQGLLEGPDGAHGGDANLEFRLYNSVTGCCQIGPTESRPDWPIKDGLFSVELDFGIQSFAGNRWLEVRVNGTALEPRQPVTSAPLAVRAAWPWESAGSSGISYSDASVGIGTSPNSSNRVRIRASHASQNALNVIDHTGVTRLRVAPNGGVSAGTNALPPADGLRVGNGLVLYGGAPEAHSLPSIRGRTDTNNLIVNAADGGALFFNFDSGDGGIRFHDGSGGGGELMRLTGSGNLGIGTSSPAERLHVSGHIRATGSGIFDGFIHTAQMNAAFITFTHPAGSGDQSVCRDTVNGFLGVCSSSIRLKSDVIDMPPASDLLMQLRPIQFRWIHTGRADLGLVAEEVASILPELVTYHDDGQVAGVNYRHLTAVLAKALQEVVAETTDLRREVSELQSHSQELQRLKERLAHLETQLNLNIELASASGQ